MVKEKTLKIFNKLIDFIDDILLLMGIWFLCRGIFMIYVPAGYIAIGICLLAFAFFIVRKKVIADAYAKLNK